MVHPSLILEVLRSLLPNFSEYIFTFLVLLGRHTEYNFNNTNYAYSYINIELYIFHKIIFLYVPVIKEYLRT